jgi:hypothetical protein
MSYRLTNEQKHGMAKKLQPLRRLAGHYRNWFRLPGSDTLDEVSGQAESGRDISEQDNAAAPATLTFSQAELQHSASYDDMSDLRLPIPESKRPIDPPTGHRAPPTKLWKMDFFIWCQIWNTIFQIFLCFFMWHYNRIDRPSWSTGLFVALACGVAGIGGIVSYIEGRKVKKVEGVPWTAAQLAARGFDQDTDLELQQTPSGTDSTALREKEKKGADALV